MKICLIRLDKIGDLVSTLPVDQIPELKGHTVRWVIAEGLGFLAKRADPHREFFEIPLPNTALAQKKLRDYLREEKFDLAVFFYGPWWVSKILWQAHVPRRFGRRSQWHSYLLLNEGLRQSRSQGLRHEADYNLELLLAALKGAIGREEIAQGRTAPVLSLRPGTFRHLFEKFELHGQDYFVVHPGMAGSALNWPTKNYVTLIDQLKIEKEVVITGTKADERWLAPLKERFGQDPRVQILQDQLSLDELLFILKNSAGVVAPSTGILHLAASVGVPCVGIYSPIASQNPRRWGPRGHHAHFLLAKCPEGTPESKMNLESVTPEQVIECLRP